MGMAGGMKVGMATQAAQRSVGKVAIQFNSNTSEGTLQVAFCCW